MRSIFCTWNSYVSQLEEIKGVDSSVSFTLVFTDEEIEFSREQITFSNSHIEWEERLVLELLAPRPVSSMTPGTNLASSLAWSKHSKP